MNLDGTTIGAFFGFLGLVVTAISGVYVATRTNQTEKESSALKALEETRDEAYQARITLRDEQIEQLRSDLNDCRMENRLRIEELESENDRMRVDNSRLQKENDKLRVENHTLKES